MQNDMAYGVEWTALKQRDPGVRRLSLISVKDLVGKLCAVVDHMINGTNTESHQPSEASHGSSLH
jgi:hypothetical protein